VKLSADLYKWPLRLVGWAFGSRLLSFPMKSAIYLCSLIYLDIYRSIRFLGGQIRSLMDDDVAAPRRNEAPLRDNRPPRRVRCYFCDEDHLNKDCQKKMTYSQRMFIVKTRKLCRKCLGTNHAIENCNVPVECRICQGPHYDIVCPLHGNSLD